MRQFRTVAIGLAVTFLIAGCGSSPNGPSTAENQALSVIPGANEVLSYPIPTVGIQSYLPDGQTVGAPAYAFTVRRKGVREPEWVLAGPKGAKVLHAYPNLAAAAKEAGKLGVAPSAFAILGSGPLGRLKLPVIGAHLGAVAGAQLRKLGLKLPGSSYAVLSIVTLPQHSNASQLGVAHFVLGSGKVVGEYGGSR